MSTVIYLSFPIVAVALASFAAYRSMKRSHSVKRSFKFNFATLAVVSMLFVIFSFSASADTATTASCATADASNNIGLALIAAGLCTGLTGIGAGIALASGVPAAIGAVSEDPKAFGKSLIFVALGETLALYGVVISVMIISKVTTAL